MHWKDWCWSWNSNTLATSYEQLTHWKRPWCWEGLGARGEGDEGGWDGWMASPTRWTWIWVNSRSWWWTRRPGVLQFMGSQRVGHDWVTELNWTEPYTNPCSATVNTTALGYFWPVYLWVRIWDVRVLNLKIHICMIWLVSYFMGTHFTFPFQSDVACKGWISDLHLWTTDLKLGPFI